MQKEQERTAREGNATVTVRVTFPSIHLFREWDEDCKATFGDCRYLKMISDHKAAKSLDLINDIYGEVTENRERIDKLEGKPEGELHTLTLGKQEQD